MELTIRVTDNQFENGVILTSEDGNILEIAVTHLPGSTEQTFTIGTYDSAVGPEESYQTLYTCPVEAA
jgi:hypothetical protein